MNKLDWRVEGGVQSGAQIPATGTQVGRNREPKSIALQKKKIMHLIKLLSFIEKLHFKNSRLFFSVLNHKLLAIRYYISNFLVSLRVPSMMFDLL